MEFIILAIILGITTVIWAVVHNRFMVPYYKRKQIEADARKVRAREADIEWGRQRQLAIESQNEQQKAALKKSQQLEQENQIRKQIAQEKRPMTLSEAMALHDRLEREKQLRVQRELEEQEWKQKYKISLPTFRGRRVPQVRVNPKTGQWEDFENEMEDFQRAMDILKK